MWQIYFIAGSKTVSGVDNNNDKNQDVENKSHTSTWIAFAVFVLVSLFFYLFPQVDLWVAQQFYQPENGGFYMNEYGWIQFFYDVFKHAWKPMMLVMLVILLLSVKFEWFKLKRKITAFALVTLLVGPGIIVHTVFKDSWDRARPRHIVEFGGDKQFTPAWVISDQCESNCSFVSGHAAMGFYFMILGWLLRSRNWFYIGIAIGALSGLIRVVQGGHFLSDSILAGFMVYWSIWIFAKWMKVPNPDQWQEAESEK